MPEPEIFEDLVADIRATAPRPRESFAAGLDRRVEAGFPKRRREPVTLWRPALALAACVLLAVVVAFGSLPNGSDDSEESSGGSVESNSSQTARPAAPAGGRAFDTTTPKVPGRRSVERRTALELETDSDEFADATDGVLRVADEAGTIVQRSRVTERDGRGRATFDLRVPGSRLDEVLADLSALGHVTARRASSQDITSPTVSARERLQDARRERAALLRALGRATSANETAALRTRLRDARRRIAVARRDVQRLVARADRTRVDVTVTSTGRRGDGGAWTPGDALGDAGRVLEVAAGVALVAGALLLPVALLAALAAGAARMTRRRRRDAALG